MTKPWRILIVDDDAEMRALLQRFLAGEGFAVRGVADGPAMFAALGREPADVIVLDLMLPGVDGLALCRRLRADGDPTPILMLTAKGDPIDKVVGLELGADDYLSKPFLPRELTARLSAILRRAAGRSPADSGNYRFGPFSLNLRTMRLERDGVVVPLSSRELQVLSALASARTPLSRAQLVERAHGRDADVSDRAIDVQVARLRKALGDDPGDPQWIRTVWGVGYVLSGFEPC